MKKSNIRSIFYDVAEAWVFHRSLCDQCWLESCQTGKKLKLQVKYFDRR